MPSHASASTTGRSPLALATGFLGAFVMASLVVQMVRTNAPSASSQNPSSVQPVVAHQSALWQSLGIR